MDNRNRHINGKPFGAMKNSAGKGFDDDVLFNAEDSALYGEISSYMKARLDIEDVKNDPSLDKTRDVVDSMISDYKMNLATNSENAKFIKGALADSHPEEEIQSEISEIKGEAKKFNINDISVEWVNEWHRKKQMAGTPDQKSNEIKDFIEGSLKSESASPAEEGKPDAVIVKKRSYFIRYISFAAAAVLGAFILIRTLLPSSDPGRLFIGNYEPFEAVAPAVRSLSGEATGLYASAIESYKSGDYQSASTMFNNVLTLDPFAGSALFFLGLTDLALGNYDQAAGHLRSAEQNAGEYGKEAQWYLGLAYLKTGDKVMAAECFSKLTQTDGYYRERSEKLLRRLK